MQKGCTPGRQSACCGECSNPKNVQELKAYLGLLTHYGKFLPDLSTKLASLYQVLRKNAPWHWREKQKEAFEASIELLTSSCLLAHINPQLKLVLACDASAYRVSAVLVYQMPDGSEQLIGYICISHLDEHWEKLLTAWKGGTTMHLLGETFPRLLVWTSFWIGNWLSATSGTHEWALPNVTTSISLECGDGHCSYPCMSTLYISDGQKLMSVQAHLVGYHCLLPQQKSLYHQSCRCST